jgi:integrase
MARNLLTDKEFRNAKQRAKDYRLRDGDGGFVLVASTGGKSFQFRYKLNGKGQTVTLKEANTLTEARDEFDRLRKIVAAGDDPRVVKRVARAVKVAGNAQTFEVIAAAWVKAEARRKKWSPDYSNEVESSLRNHLHELDGLPVSKIVASVTAPILHTVEFAAPDMAEKVARRLDAIMNHAVERGALERNPLPRRRPVKRARTHYAAITTIKGIGKLLRDARAADPCKGIARAHLLLAFEGQRISETVGAKWDEFDLRAATWSIPRERMKRKDKQRGPHDVPIPPTLLALLGQWQKNDAGTSEYVCPAPRDPKRSITREAVEKFYRRALGLEGKHGPNSWRSTFSTIARDAGKDGDVVEAQLDHVVGSNVAAAYDRAKRLALRRELMRWYERQLIAARDGAAVLPIKGCG